MRKIVDGKARCFCCRRWKPVDQFYKNSHRCLIVQRHCKECASNGSALANQISSQERRRKALIEIRKNLGKPHP